MRPSTKRKLLRLALLAGGFALVWYMNKPEAYDDEGDRPPFDNEHEDGIDADPVARLPRGGISNGGRHLPKPGANGGRHLPPAAAAAAAAAHKRPGFQQPRAPKSPKQDETPAETRVTKVTPEPTTKMHPTTKEWVNQLTAPQDYRDKECVPEYDRLSALPVGTLPNTTVIFCFCNEPAKSLHFSMLSVIERSPRHLLHEIVLVDDGSNAPHIMGPLEDFAKTLPVPVTIVRQGYRSGLMRARVAGARVATGETLTFLDSHISCDPGWLEPMMWRIHQDWSNVVMPKIDAVDRDFNYKPGGVELVGFNSRLTDHGIQLQKSATSVSRGAFPARNAVDPQVSPAMAGGLFSVSRAYFFHIGAFDEGMLHWGGENIEIGFRVWQCGGRIELIPCSRIAHVWGGMGAGCGWPGASPGAVNKWRAIDTWMDNYTSMMEAFLPRAPVGNLTEMVNLRKRLECRSFQWFLDEVYPDCWINIILASKRSGVLKNKATGECIDPRAQGGAKMVPCKTHQRNGNSQFFWQTKNDELRLNIFGADMDHCIEAAIPGDGFKTPQNIMFYGCHGYGGNQKFVFEARDSSIRHDGARGCVQASGPGGIPQVGECHDPLPESQQWDWVRPDDVPADRLY